MNPILTTVTPYWQRTEMLRCWFKSVADASRRAGGRVHHILFVVGCESNEDFIWRCAAKDSDLFTVIILPDDQPGKYSIGYYHNAGAKIAKSQWVMKMDVDTIPHDDFFLELLPRLETARPREWFNVGMLYADAPATLSLLNSCNLPLSVSRFDNFIERRKSLCVSGNSEPAATNFVCRREDYLALGGTDENFRGYGWEDYEVVYKLERFQRGDDPLPGDVNIQNVTRRCRDEISRRKARELFEKNNRLCLIHRWHEVSRDTRYRSRAIMDANKKILLDSIIEQRRGLAGRENEIHPFEQRYTTDD